MSGSGSEGGEHAVALLVGEAAEVELVVVAEEHGPLCGGGAAFGGGEGGGERAPVGGGEGVEQVLVDLEVEHQLQAFAALPK